MKTLGYLVIAFVLSNLCMAQTWQRQWKFDGSLMEANGKCPFFITPQQPVFETDGGRKVLKLTGKEIFTTNDDVVYRLQPGFRFACRVKFNKLNVDSGWTTIFSKGKPNDKGAIWFRLDKFPEASKISLFINLTGSPEPRVSAELAPVADHWYDMEGGWDGSDLWLSVDGKVTKRKREGEPAGNFAPLGIGPFDGCIADVRFGGIEQSNTIIGNWPFDGSLADISGHGHDFEPQTNGQATFVHGKALSRVPLSTPSAPDLHLVPGFNIHVSVMFTSMPVGETVILFKRNEYLLRYDTRGQNKGAFNCYYYLDGHWEPHSGCPVDLKLNHWYHIATAWNGQRATVQVDGEEHDIARRALPKPTDYPLEIGTFDGAIDNLVIDRQPVQSIFLTDIRTLELFPREGEPLTVVATLTSMTDQSGECDIRLVPPEGFICTEPVQHLGKLTANTVKQLTWKLQAAKSAIGRLTLELSAGDRKIATATHEITVVEKEDLNRSAKVWNPSVSGSSCFYIDTVSGNDASDGRTPATAWRSFANINGKTLQPGERLLLKRGSVFREELKLSAQGTPDNWAEISAYGEGPRPVIRRNRFIDDRCAYITNPDYLVVRNLVVCNAGKGLDITHLNSGHYGVLVENCLAHHIEGLYRFNAHGIPEWRDRHGAAGSGNAGGIAVGGMRATDIVFRDCEMYQCSVAFRATGDKVFLHRIFCHDNAAHNTSPHPVISSTTRSVLADSVFDASGWNASAGTMGIMLGPNYGFIIRNCHWLNQPDSGSHDEGGIDFEAGGEANIIEHCTFRNNAGAAIEVLGLRSPQTKNVLIQNCRFDRNNTATKLGPSEIFVWGGSTDRNIVCSNGLIRNNGYVLLPGIDFYVNKAASTVPDWKLENNTNYDSSEALDKAMPFNNPPVPVACDEIWSEETTVSLKGTVTDDGRSGAAVTTRWEQLEGPAVISFDKADLLSTTAVFPQRGDYRLLLKADDGELWRSSRTAVHILPAGTSVRKAWTFSRNHDKEGWTDYDLGTEKEYFRNSKDLWGGTFANPVNLVCGDFYVMALKETATAHILSADTLSVNAADCQSVRLRMQNHTPSKRMKLSFITAEKPDWKDAVAVDFDVIANDEEDTVYVVALPPSTGHIKQLRLDFAGEGKPITGTCRIDNIALLGRK